MREWLRRRVVDFKCWGHWAQHVWRVLGPYSTRCLRCGTERHIRVDPRTGTTPCYTYTPKTYPRGGHKL